MTYCDPKDAAIVEENKGYPMQVLYDCDGNVLYKFSAAWTHDQIMTALNFANDAFSRGVRVGRSDKAFEIRKLLGMTS